MKNINYSNYLIPICGYVIIMYFFKFEMAVYRMYNVQCNAMYNKYNVHTFIHLCNLKRIHHKFK